MGQLKTIMIQSTIGNVTEYLGNQDMRGINTDKVPISPR